ncbi:glycerophosphodiester phosphodiesterase [Desulfotignum balticum]|uniref:glycerophosphodiester phosphodiesterase n=1 Tax=Desulfotignum balticum TaxID=115781 RepID=UPI00307D1485
MYYKIIDAEMIEQAHRSGLEILCWTVDDPVKARQLIDLGVTGITTNRPAWLKSNVTRGFHGGPGTAMRNPVSEAFKLTGRAKVLEKGG